MQSRCLRLFAASLPSGPAPGGCTQEGEQPRTRPTNKVRILSSKVDRQEEHCQLLRVQEPGVGVIPKDHARSAVLQKEGSVRRVVAVALSFLGLSELSCEGDTTGCGGKAGSSGHLGRRLGERILRGGREEQGRPRREANWCNVHDIMAGSLRTPGPVTQQGALPPASCPDPRDAAFPPSSVLCGFRSEGAVSRHVCRYPLPSPFTVDPTSTSPSLCDRAGLRNRDPVNLPRFDPTEVRQKQGMENGDSGGAFQPSFRDSLRIAFRREEI